jgi:hypothetical protein
MEILPLPLPAGYRSTAEPSSQLSMTVGFSLYRLGSDLTENTSFAQQWIHANHIENTASSIIFTAPLHRNGSYPIIIGFVFRCRGDVFTELLPSNGSACHNIVLGE